MKKWFKRGIFIVVTLLIVTLIGAAVFLLTFDPNAYKERVEQLVYERYQRQLSIDGEIELSLFPRIGLSVEEVSLSDRKSNQPFASIDSARVAVAVWPLLWNHLVVDHVALNGFKVWLTVNDQDEFNFTDLLQKVDSPNPNSSSSSDTSTDETVLQIDIAGVDLQDGEIHFSDANSQAQMQLVGLTLNTGRMTFDQPFDVIFKGELQGEKPQTSAQLEGQAVLQLEPQLKRYLAKRINVTLAGDIGRYHSENSSLRGELELLSLTEDLRARHLEFISQGSWKNRDFQLDDIRLQVDLAQLNIKRNLQFITTDQLKVRANSLVATKDTNSDTNHQFELALDVPELNIEPNHIQSQPVDFSFQQRQSENDLHFAIKGHIDAVGGNLKQLQLNEMNTDIVGKNTDTAWQLKGSTHAQITRAENDMVVQWQGIDADIRVDDEGLDPSPAHARLTGNGQWQRASQQAQFIGLWQSANTHADITSQLEPNDNNWLWGVDIAAKELDIQPWLRHPSAQSRPLLGQQLLTSPMLPSLLPWHQVESQFTVQAPLFEGELNAKGAWQFADGALQLQATVNDANLQPLSRFAAKHIAFDRSRYLEGRGQLDIDIQTYGSTFAAWQAALSGQASLQAKEGRLVGWSFWPQLSLVPSTPYSQLDAQVDLQQGQALFSRIWLQSAEGKISATPNSYIDLVNGQLQLEMETDAMPSSTLNDDT